MALAGAIIATSAPTHAGEPPDASTPFFFIQMADPQLGFFANPLPLAYLRVDLRPEDVARDVPLFEQAIAHANRLRPAFVVICGDLVHHPRHPVQITAFNRVRARLDADIPLYLVAGNHDVGNTPTPALLRSYRATFGSDRYTFDHAGMRGIVLNSVLMRAPAEVPHALVAQRQWLAHTLADARRDGVRQLLVFQHHPFFLDDPAEPTSYFNIPSAERARHLELFREHGVQAVLAGHYHRNAIARDGALEMITTSAVGRPLGDDPSGFRIVKVWPDRIEHAYYALDEVPEQVTLEASSHELRTSP